MGPTMGHKTLYYAVGIRSLFHTSIAFPQKNAELAYLYERARPELQPV